MKTQFDHSERVVALSNLEAMCERVSGVCHRYQVAKVTTNRVHIEYSNPDEYGHERPITAVLPCWPCSDYDQDDRVVALTLLRVLHDDQDGEGWQSFQPLLDCPELWRSGPEADDWSTYEERIGSDRRARMESVEAAVSAAVASALASCGVTAPNRDYIAGQFAPEVAAGIVAKLRSLL